MAILGPGLSPGYVNETRYLREERAEADSAGLVRPLSPTIGERRH